MLWQKKSKLVAQEWRREKRKTEEEKVMSKKRFSTMERTEGVEGLKSDAVSTNNSHVGCLCSFWCCSVFWNVNETWSSWTWLTMTMMRCAPLPTALSWTRSPAVVRRCAFVCFGGVALGGDLRWWWWWTGVLYTFKIQLILAGFFNVTNPSFKESKLKGVTVADKRRFSIKTSLRLWHQSRSQDSKHKNYTQIFTDYRSVWEWCICLHLSECILHLIQCKIQSEWHQITWSCSSVYCSFSLPQAASSNPQTHSLWHTLTHLHNTRHTSLPWTLACRFWFSKPP